MDSSERDLVTLVQQNPILWDSTLSEYKDQRKREIVWMIIAVKLEIDVKEVEYRWKCIRRKFVRASRNFRRGGVEDIERWPLLQHLQFLKKVVHHRRPQSNKNQFRRPSTSATQNDSLPSTSASSIDGTLSSNCTLNSEEILEDMEISPFYETREAVPVPNKKTGNKGTTRKAIMKKDLEKKLLNYLEDTENVLLKKSAVEEDEDVSFFRGTVSLIKDFSPEKKLRFKSKYLELITQFRNEESETNETNETNEENEE